MLTIVISALETFSKVLKKELEELEAPLVV